MFCKIGNVQTGNFTEGIPEFCETEYQTDFLKLNSFKLERIVSYGQKTTDGFWYDSPQGEWVMVLEGSGVVEFENGDSFKLLTGQYLNIPAHAKHRVTQTASEQKTVWLCIYYNED